MIGKWHREQIGTTRRDIQVKFLVNKEELKTIKLLEKFLNMSRSATLMHSLELAALRYGLREGL